MDPEIIAPEVPATADAPSSTPAVEKPAAADAPADKPVAATDRRGIIKQAMDQAAKGEKPTVKVAQNAAGRSFDPASGKFLATKAALTDRAEPAVAPQAAAPSQAAPAAPQQPAAAPQVLGVPGSLKAHLKARFNELPAEWQEEITRLDRTGAEAGQKFAPQIQAYKDIQAVIAPYENILRATGRTPTQTIAAMMNAEAALLTGSPQQKAQMFRQFMQQYNVPPELVFQGMQPQQPSIDGQQQPAQMPDISQHPLMQQMTQQVSTISQHFTQQQQAQQRAQAETANKAVSSFLAETKPNGTPKFPMDDSLEEAFAAEIGMVKQANPDRDARFVLEAAYQNLAWKTPQLREVLLKDQEAERAAKLQQELAAKKAAGVSVKGGPAAPSTGKADPKDRRAFIKSQFATHGR